VGVVLPGCDINLSNGDEGEILVKAPGMFLRYHQDPEATQAAYNKDGYYKTGDIGRRQGPYFFISGRASIDSKL
jgi:malonyl-CoA/methylmalonyl-CoA synthetase